MNKLMFAPFGAIRYMAEAGGEGGGSTTTTAAGETTPPAGETKPGETKPGETTPPAGETKPGETTPPAGETKPGETKPGETSTEMKSALETKAGETTPPAGETKPGETKPASEVNDEDFIKLVVADEETKKLAEKSGTKDFELSAEVTKRMLPAFRDAGITPEQASKLSNAYARDQISQITAYRQQRIENIKLMNQEAFKAFPNESDWKAIATARDYFFKPAGKDGKGGTMLHTIATSELGSDLEFLALLKFVGEKLGTDRTPTAGGAGAGHPKVSMAKALGLEK